MESSFLKNDRDSLWQKSSLDGNEEMVPRKSADYAPSYWGDFFVTLPSVTPDMLVDKKIEELKQHVKMMILQCADKPLQQMELIDAILRLGLGYHFEEEIEAAVKNLNDARGDESLHIFAIRFRLLRQNGQNVPSDGFNKFRDNNGKFKESLSGDARGLLSLYEAAHFGVPEEEEIMEEAIVFTSDRLKIAMDRVCLSLKLEIQNALKTPLRKAMGRLQARLYISIYGQDEARHEELLELAKLDFNRLQRLNQKELKDISMWWKELGLARKMSFARDRIVEGYFWALGVCYEPCCSRARIIFTKLIAFVSLMDDIYDVYGTLEELVQFNNAIQRWEIEDMQQQLPECMMLYLSALMGTFKYIEEELKEEGNSYRVFYLKEAWKAVANASLKEFIWGSEKYVPKFDEHLQVSLITSTFPMLCCAALLGMGEIATKEAFDWVINLPHSVMASALICRLTDDLKPDKLEQEKDHVVTSVQSYATEYGVSQKAAHSSIARLIRSAWNGINKELLEPNPLPLALLTPGLNLACMMELVFKNSDGYNDPAGEMKDYVTMLLVDPVII